MSNNGQFRKLLSPIQVRNLKLKNRIVKSPQATIYVTKEGHVEGRTKAFYEALARGGVGMIVLGAVSVSTNPIVNGLIQICDDKYISTLSQLTQVVHKYSTKIFAQLWHIEPAFAEVYSGVQPYASSALSKDEVPSPEFDPTRELSLSEVKEMQELFVKGAERAKKAGFDGVEVHAAHCYLLASFISRVWNRRQDEYGCQNLRNRTRIAVEIIQEIKRRLGKDYPVGVRISGEEWEIENGITSEESQEIARILEEAGADYIHVSGYGYGKVPFRYVPDHWLVPEPSEVMKSYKKRLKKPGMLIPAAEAIKKVVSVPVIGVGHLTPQLGEWLLQKGKVDMIAFGRPLFADPELSNKLAENRVEDIAPCTRCGTCYEGSKRCRINAALGTVDWYIFKPAERKKKVMVVGGGPAGMEVARVAATRGHEVSLYEKDPNLGGLLPLAAMIKGTELEDIPALVRYLKTQIYKLGVKVNLGKEVTPELVDEVKPDVVILAAGGKYTVPEIPGNDRHNVVSSAELSRRVKLPLRIFGPKSLRWLTQFVLPVGKRVIVMGGLLEGVETAEFLIRRGRKVTLVEASDKLGDGIPPLNLERMLPWLTAKGVTIMTEVKYEQITEKGLTITTKEGKKQTIEADTVMVAMPQQPNTQLFKSLEKKVPEAYLVGPSDGNKSWVIVDAIAEARRVGLAI